MSCEVIAKVIANRKTTEVVFLSKFEVCVQGQCQIPLKIEGHFFFRLKGRFRIDLNYMKWQSLTRSQRPYLSGPWRLVVFKSTINSCSCFIRHCFLKLIPLNWRVNPIPTMPFPLWQCWSRFHRILWAQLPYLFGRIP